MKSQITVASTRSTVSGSALTTPACKCGATYGHTLACLQSAPSYTVVSTKSTLVAG